MTRRILLPFAAIYCLLMLNGCPSPMEVGVEPPQPNFIATTYPPSPIDHGLYADPGLDFIVMEWNADPTRTTTGYQVFRSTNGTLGIDGLLRDGSQIATIESPNQLFETLDTSFIDSLGSSAYAFQYFYQVRAYHTSGSSKKTFGKPSAVGSFGLLPKPTINAPSGDTVDAGSFSWNDGANGGKFQIIVRNADTKEIMWGSNYIFEFSGGTLNNFYNSDLLGKPLISGQHYQWRVKKIGDRKGSSSYWQNFSVK
jgi:hypothetical protein